MIQWLQAITTAVYNFAHGDTTGKFSVLCFFRSHQESNLAPSASESNALSTELPCFIFFLYSVGKVPEGVVSHNSTSNLKFLNQFLHSRVPMIGQVAPFLSLWLPTTLRTTHIFKFLVENGKVWSVKAYSCWTIISRFSKTFWITRAKISSEFPPPIQGVPWSLISCTHSKTHTLWNSILLVHIRSHILWCIYFLTL